MTAREPLPWGVCAKARTRAFQKLSNEFERTRCKVEEKSQYNGEKSLIGGVEHTTQPQQKQENSGREKLPKKVEKNRGNRKNQGGIKKEHGCPMGNLGLGKKKKGGMRERMALRGEAEVRHFFCRGRRR